MNKFKSQVILQISLFSLLLVSNAIAQDYKPKINIEKPSYIVKDDQLFYHDRAIKNADIDSFEVIDQSHAKDKNTVYWKETVVLYADPETFEIIGRNYAKDKNHVFHSFADNNIWNVYWSNSPPLNEAFEQSKKASVSKELFYEIVYLADPNTFELIENDYARDNNHIFSKGYLLPNVDPNTFEIINESYRKDAK